MVYIWKKFFIAISLISFTNSTLWPRQLNSVNHVYFVSQTQTDSDTQQTIQQIGSFDLNHQETLVLEKIPITDLNKTIITMGVHDDAKVMFYTIQSNLQPPYYPYLTGYVLNSTISNISPLKCVFSETYFNGNPIVGFVEKNGFAVLLVAHSTQFEISLLHVQLFDPDWNGNGCVTNLLSSFEISQYQTHLTSGVLGIALDPERSTVTVLHNKLGLLFLDYNSTNNFVLDPLANMTVTSIASETAPNGDIFILIANQSTNQNPEIARMDFQTRNITTLFKANLGQLAYDSHNNYFLQLVQGNTLNLYDYLGNRLAGNTVNVAWQFMLYHSGKETPFCPRGCRNRGQCINHACMCNHGWSKEDCSECNSDSFCNGHGICQIDTVYGNRSCQCVVGWLPPNCNVCNSNHFCSGHGNCSSDNNGACTCFNGFFGNACGNCNSSILCNGHGSCFSNGTCLCTELWTGDDCLHFDIPNKYMVYAIQYINYITMALWLAVLVASLIGALLHNFEYPKSLISYIGFQSSILYFQSFALLINNSSIRSLCFEQFRYFNLVNLDIYNAFPSVQQTIWTESAMFFPKIFIFIILLLSWKIFKGDNIRGFILRLGFSCYFLFHVSFFLRFQQNCQECNQTYNILGTILAVILLGLSSYLTYKLWHVLSLNKHYFEGSSSSIELHSVILDKIKYHLRPWSFQLFIWVYNILNVLLFPLSEILSFIFSRLCEIDSTSMNTSLPSPPPITPQKPKTHKYQPDCSVESFLVQVAKKIDHAEDMDIDRIVSMLKGNWYTTVADLRTLSEADAEKLNIPRRLWAAMQEELPREDIDAYTALDSLLQNSQKASFMATYGFVGSPYKTTNVLFKLDQLLLRSLLWALLGAALWQYSLLQLIFLLILQVWYTCFVLWQRPYKFIVDFVSDFIPQFALVVVIIMLITFAERNEAYVVLMVISVINLVVVLFSCGSHAVYHLYIKLISPVEQEDENSPLIKEDIKRK